MRSADLLQEHTAGVAKSVRNGRPMDNLVRFRLRAIVFLPALQMRHFIQSRAHFYISVSATRTAIPSSGLPIAHLKIMFVFGCGPQKHEPIFPAHRLTHVQFSEKAIDIDPRHARVLSLGPAPL